MLEEIQITHKSTKMNNFNIILAFVFLLSVILSLCSVQPLSFKSNDMKSLLEKINKPALKTITSPDGDLIDCVPFHLQLAFDHPLLKDHKHELMDTPEIPKENTSKTEVCEEHFQLWSTSGESCPDNTVAIRRTTEKDILRAKSVRKFGKKIVRMDANGSYDQNEFATGRATGTFFGAKANSSVWVPQVQNEYELSISQMWVADGAFETQDLNTIEVGWLANHGENHSRLFVGWTSDAYNQTGCYNTDCPGFVQKSKKIAVGAAILRSSIYNGNQYEISTLVEMDQKGEKWWLWINGERVGYWPSQIFSLLKDSATMVQFGGHVINTGSSGHHTTTQMGSGHFAEAAYGKAAMMRYIKVVDSKNNLIQAPQLYGKPDHPDCYDAAFGGKIKDWGTYFYYGGPGKNPKCP